MAEDIYPIFADPAEVNQKADEALTRGIESQFPVENKNYKITVSDLHVARKVFSKQEEKDAILRSKSLTYPIKGTLTLYDRHTGKVLDQLKDFSLADAYYFTTKHTLIHKGNNYIVANQLILRPGVFTRTTTMGELSAHVNTGTGQSFFISLHPKTNLFTLDVANASIPIAPVLTQVFGFGPGEITRYIPAEVWEANKAKTQGREDKVIGNLYSRLVSTRLQDKNASLEDKIQALREAFENSKLDLKTTKTTLGKSFASVTGEVLLRTMKNLVQVHTGEREEDNRDSLQFKRVQNLPDYIDRRFNPDKSHESVNKVVKKIAFNLERIDPKDPKIKDAIRSKPFNKVYSDFILNSSLVTTPEETNPVESIENVGKVTIMGPEEGGIGSAHQASPGSRNIDPSHLGVIDPSRTPESEHVGLDQRFTISARRDKEGNLYARVLDNQGKVHFLSTDQMLRSVIGFPQQKDKKEVTAQDHGEIKDVPRARVQYWIPSSSDMYTITTNLVPFLNSNHPGRLTMAGKAIPQALSLRDREVPLVQTVGPNGKTFVNTLGSLIGTKSPVDGIVTSVTKGLITIKGKDGKTYKVDLVQNLPFNVKGFLDDEHPLVKEGDKVSAGQTLVDNNYTKDGDLALGRNLYAAYLPYKGYNHEDGLVISQGAADNLKSQHAYKVDYDISKDSVTKKALFKQYFPSSFTPEQLAKLDDRGFAKKGSTLEKGDPVYAVLERREPSPHDLMLGRLHKTMIRPYNKVVDIWDHDEPAQVVDTHTESDDVRILLRSLKTLEIGDKLTGLHGNKGIVSLILPDDQMPKSKTTNKPVDILLNPASVTSRINLGQLAETVAGKIAQKEGKPYKLTNYENENNLQRLKDQLKEHDLSDTDTVVDPTTGKEMQKVLAGPQYFLKLYKTTDQNFSARNVGSYDIYRQPSKGGHEGAKSVGYMEMLGLLGSNARKNLKEIGTVKSEENTDYWDRFMSGMPLPKPKTTFATQKFFDTLKGAGVKVNFSDGKIIAAPMTDEDILAQSHGEIQDPSVVNARNLAPEKGGIFDPASTGGLKGTNWTHYQLAEPIVNPIFENPTKSLLGLTTNQFDGLTKGSLGIKKTDDGYHLVSTEDGSVVGTLKPGSVKPFTKKAALPKKDPEEPVVGGEAFKELLSGIDVARETEEVRQALKQTKSQSTRDKLLKKLRYLNGLKRSGFNDPSKAYILHNMPVLPPVARPLVLKGGHRLELSDVNQLYREHLMVNDPLKEVRHYLPPQNLTGEREALYDGAKAILGLGDAISGASRAKQRQGQIKGLLRSVAGEGGPKTGFFMDRVLKKRQDFSGRATVYAAPNVGFNEAEVPKDMLWTMYKSHIIRDLRRRGYDAVTAESAWKKRNGAAQAALDASLKNVPVLLNRAPTLMRSNIMAMYAKPVEGKTIGINPLHLPGFAADYDGDAFSVYLPMTPEAVDEAKKKMLPEHNIYDYRKGVGHTMFAPGHEAILGSVYMTEPDMKQETRTYKSEADVLKALKNGEIFENTPVKISK